MDCLQAAHEELGRLHEATRRGGVERSYINRGLEAVTLPPSEEGTPSVAQTSGQSAQTLRYRKGTMAGVLRGPRCGSIWLSYDRWAEPEPLLATALLFWLGHSEAVEPLSRGQASLVFTPCRLESRSRAHIWGMDAEWASARQHSAARRAAPSAPHAHLPHRPGRRRDRRASLALRRRELQGLARGLLHGSVIQRVEWGDDFDVEPPQHAFDVGRLRSLGVVLRRCRGSTSTCWR